MLSFMNDNYFYSFISDVINVVSIYENNIPPVYAAPAPYNSIPPIYAHPTPISDIDVIINNPIIDTALIQFI